MEYYSKDYCDARTNLYLNCFESIKSGHYYVHIVLMWGFLGCVLYPSYYLYRRLEYHRSIAPNESVFFWIKKYWKNLFISDIPSLSTDIIAIEFVIASLLRFLHFVCLVFDIKIYYLLNILWIIPWEFYFLICIQLPLIWLNTSNAVNGTTYSSSTPLSIKLFGIFQMSCFLTYSLLELSEFGLYFRRIIVGIHFIHWITGLWTGSIIVWKFSWEAINTIDFLKDMNSKRVNEYKRAIMHCLMLCMILCISMFIYGFWCSMIGVFIILGYIEKYSVWCYAVLYSMAIFFCVSVTFALMYVLPKEIAYNSSKPVNTTLAVSSEASNYIVITPRSFSNLT